MWTALATFVVLLSVDNAKGASQLSLPNAAVDEIAVFPGCRVPQGPAELLYHRAGLSVGSWAYQSRWRSLIHLPGTVGVAATAMVAFPRSQRDYQVRAPARSNLEDVPGLRWSRTVVAGG
jgi:hypothetical protein